MPSSIHKTIKRFMDLAMTILFMLIFSWLYLIVAFLIWVQDRHNPIYHHTRIGLNKKSFEFYKFRSMVVNADEILFSNPEMLKKLRTGSNKIANDPRVTRIGKFIRKYSIDEIPQMYNVLKGDMSVIGPRALRPDEFEGFEKKSTANREKLATMTSVKPGITGLWQVSGRSQINFEQRIDMECEYAKRKSIMLDLYIILKTPLAVLRGEGAY